MKRHTDRQPFASFALFFAPLRETQSYLKVELIESCRFSLEAQREKLKLAKNPMTVSSVRNNLFFKNFRGGRR